MSASYVPGYILRAVDNSQLEWSLNSKCEETDNLKNKLYFVPEGGTCFRNIKLGGWGRAGRGTSFRNIKLGGREERLGMVGETTHLNTVVREALTEMVTFQQRLEGDKGTSHENIWGK